MSFVKGARKGVCYSEIYCALSTVCRWITVSRASILTDIFRSQECASTAVRVTIGLSQLQVIHKSKRTSLFWRVVARSVFGGLRTFLLTDCELVVLYSGGGGMEQSPSALQDARNLGFGPSSASPSSASAVYSSPRTDRMMQTRSDYSTDLEYEIESSRVHWSEVAPIADDSELVPPNRQTFIEQGIMVGEKVMGAYLSEICNVRTESITRDTYLMIVLSLIWPSRFLAPGIEQQQWKVGRKIGEGAQAEIYEAIPGPENESLGSEGKYILKVFREGFYARDLQRLWPKQVATGYSTLYTCPIRQGMLLDNGRFSFLMPRYWGDLRKLLDQRMQQRLDCTHPPCSDWEATRSMLYIAKGMRDLHIINIVHRDLKASNVLVEMIERSETEMEEIGNKEVDTFYCRVADFESSKGVLGTGFWRAPEILVAAKHRISINQDMFTKACDVYSYAMTCYEIWTGCLPFENLRNNEYDIVLGGERPILPIDLKPWIREMLERFWHSNPCERPTFQEICDTISNCSKEAEED